MLLACLFIIGSLYAKADHITGGEMFYTFNGYANGEYRYTITIKLFMDCQSPRQFNDPAIIGIFNRRSGNRVSDEFVRLTRTELLNLTNPGPCVTDPPPVCYRVGYYTFDVGLPGAPEGYLVTCQINYRIYGITNLISEYGNIGATYTGEIPGTAPQQNAPENNSARFTGSDLVVVCSNNSFNYSFAATDPDGDQLRYTFCNAYQTGTSGGNGAPASPPYLSVPYGPDFSGNSPLGNSIQVDPNTGMITGIAPEDGIYVVTVCVEEIRNGIVIATQRKDLQIKITSCSIASAAIPKTYMLCRNTRTIQFVNFSTSPLVRTHHWEVRNRLNIVIFSSTAASPSYTFPDTGTYSVKLVINRGDECADSNTSLARVYPGMVTQFDAAGICVTKPTQFRNRSTTQYGSLIGWSWDFGEPSLMSDISTDRDPSYTYDVLGVKNVRLIAYNTNGCIDTLNKNVTIVDKPPITLAFRDTLICTPDQLQLRASGSGQFRWTPGFHITNANTPTPTVAPPVTTMYYVELNSSGCLNNDSVRVRVVDHVTLQMMKDTTICRTDTIRLRLTSDALRYSWTPAAQLIDPTEAQPLAISNADTRYSVVARIGSCVAEGSIMVNTVPYPLADAGEPQTICHNASTRLQGAIDGNSFLWAPTSSLQDANTLQPLAKPTTTTRYVLYAWDDKGCPKPGKDTVVITVRPDILPFAGNDTSVIVGQPLQLTATGGVRYNWEPSTGLSSTESPNPVAHYLNPSLGIRYKVLVYDEGGCVDSASVLVKVFKTKPSVFVPNAFTPNGDGRNDVFRFLAAGMQKIEFFQVYNRWGQLVFSATSGNQSWDGTLGGKPQDSGTYVWMVKGLDYTGVPYQEKGILLLIR